MTWPTNPSSRTQSVHHGARKLGELAKIVTGKIDVNQAVKGGTYPFYTCADGILRISKTAFDGESILVAGNGDFWVKYHPSGKFNAYQRTYVIQNFSNETTTRYLYFVVSTQTSKFKKMAQGGIIKFLHLGQLQNLQIPLPPLQIQKQIVERMDKIAEAQKLNDELIQKAEELFQSLLHQELNSESENWEVKNLGEVANFINGKAFKPKDWGKKGLPIIRIQNLNNKDANFNYYNNKVEEKYLVQDGDLLFSWSGNIGTSFGAFIWKRGNALLNQHIFNIKIKNIDLDKDYFCFFINKIIAEIEGKTHGITGLVHITKGTLGKIKIPLPPLQIQKQIVEKLSATQKYKKQLLAQKSKLKELFDSVLHKSMKGEL